ncbi:hypothetical protein AGMMS50229_16780 [Campylobacterota bacterium]|nr:hypothetical protein AGMMS50229_16780 [Campylobacterota bacterium]
MKQFIIKLGIFAALVLTVNMLLFVAVYRANYSNLYRNDFEGEKFSSFLLGSSDAESMGNIMEEYGIYNYGAARKQSYQNMQDKLEYMLFNKIAIDTIYLSISDYAISVLHDASPDRAYDMRIRKNYSNSFEYINDRYIKYFAVLMNSYALAGTAILYRGTVLQSPPPRRFSEWSDEEQILAVESAANWYSARSKDMTQALVNILEICQENNITVIGLKYPYATRSVEMLDRHGGDDIMKQYGVRILDYRKLFVGHDDYFNDQVHMNQEGKQEFVKVFAKDIERFRDEGYIK